VFSSVVALYMAVCLNRKGPPPMNNSYSIKSRRRTPWDQSSCRTATQEFIRAENLDHYNQKHRLLRDTNEADLLNSFELTCCRLCGSTNIKKDGFDRNGVRVYYCNECRHKFSVTTGTIFQDHKIPVTEWIEYERNLFQHESLTADSWNNKNSFTTAHIDSRRLVCCSLIIQKMLLQAIMSMKTRPSLLSAEKTLY